MDAVKGFDPQLVLQEIPAAEPLMPPDQAGRAFAAFVEKRRAEFRALGIRWQAEDRVREARWLFEASEDYIGPLTASAFVGFCKRNLLIQTEGRMAPFIPNSSQRLFLRKVLDEGACKGLPVRKLILKARQMGFSTCIQALKAVICSRPNTHGTTIAHKQEATDNLRNMMVTYLTEGPFYPRLARRKMKVLEMERPARSHLRYETAEDKNAGRSANNLFLHLSESAFWKHPSTEIGLLQTVQDVPGTFIFRETTANGMGGPFFDAYQRAKSGKGGLTEALFFAWWTHARYRTPVSQTQATQIMRTLDADETWGVDLYGWTPEQVAWRRIQIADKLGGDVDKFKQEYPSNDVEAFIAQGSPVFNLRQVQSRMEQAARWDEPLLRGRLVPAETR